MVSNHYYSSIGFIIIAVHLIVCHKVTDVKKDIKDVQRNSTNDTGLEEESYRKPFFTPLSSPLTLQMSGSKKSKKSLKSKPKKKVKKIKYRKMEEEEEDEDEEEEEEEEDDDQSGDDEDLYELYKKSKSSKSKKGKTNVKYVPIPVYMASPKKDDKKTYHRDVKKIEPTYDHHDHQPDHHGGNQPIEGIKSLQMSMKNWLQHNYYNPMEDYGYMPYPPMHGAQNMPPMQGIQGMQGMHGIQDQGIYGLDQYDSMYDYNKRPNHNGMDGYKSNEGNMYYHSDGYITERPPKVTDPLDCDDDTEYKDGDSQGKSKISEYRYKIDHKGKNHFGNRDDMMSMIANLNPKRMKRKGKTTARVEDRSSEDQSSGREADGNDIHKQKANQIAQMLEMLDKMQK